MLSGDRFRNARGEKHSTWNVCRQAPCLTSERLPVSNRVVAQLETEASIRSEEILAEMSSFM